MNMLSRRSIGAIAALILVLGACSSGDSETVAAANDPETTTVVADTETTTVETIVGDVAEDTADDTADDAASSGDASADDSLEDATVEEPDSDEPVDDGSTSTENESSAAEAELEQFLSFFGITDGQAAVECIAAEAEGNGTTVEEIMASDGSPVMVAVVRCRPDEVRQSLASQFSNVDSSSIAATPEQIECSFDSMLDYIADIDLLGAEGVLEGDAPDDLVNKLANDCEITRRNRGLARRLAAKREPNGHKPGRPHFCR